MNMNEETGSSLLSSSNRRTWVKQFMLGSAATLSGPRWIGTVLADVTPAGPGPALIRLKSADIPALAAPGGSVQYRFNSGTKPFTLNRVTADRFVTLDTICTHNGCTVGRYTSHSRLDNSVMPPVTITEHYMLCPCHGSRYDVEGRIVRPAVPNSGQGDLARFETSYDSATDTVSILIPNLALSIRSISVQREGPGQAIRLKLVFPVTAYSNYEIRYRADLASAATVVLFSETPDGPLEKSSLSTFADGNFTAYVDAEGPRGFFAVGLILGNYP